MQPARLPTRRDLLTAAAGFSVIVARGTVARVEAFRAATEVGPGRSLRGSRVVHQPEDH